MTVSIHRLKIARDVRRTNDGAIALFSLNENPLCEAWFSRPDVRKISIMQCMASIEEASAVSIAINMAIEWLVEQS